MTYCRTHGTLDTDCGCEDARAILRRLTGRPHPPTETEWEQFWADQECTPGTRTRAAETRSAPEPVTGTRAARQARRTPLEDYGHYLAKEEQ